METQTFVCANCNGIIKWDIGSETFKCSACRAETKLENLSESVQEYDFSQYGERENSTVAFDGVAVVHCQNCGCKITFEEHQVATVCPMCSSTQVAAVKQAAGIPPEGIIPFKLDKNEAGVRFEAWVKSRWFAPNDFKKKCVGGSLQGMYLPFWTFDAGAVSHYSGRGGHHRTVTDSDGKSRTVTDWHSVSGVVSASFDDLQVCATEKGEAIEGILPYNTVENIRPYDPSYLSGYHAEIYSIKANQAFESAKEMMEEELTSLAEEDILQRYDEADVDSLRTKYSNVTYKHVLLPVWASAFGYQGETFNYFINGETGEVDGERPYSVPKIVAAVIAGIIVIGTLIYFFSTK